MKIYFAGSIRGGREDAGVYGEIIKMLARHGEVLTEHIGGSLSSFGESRKASDVYKRDLKWLNEADFVVAEVTQPSLGVGYEIAKAEEMGKKILCLYRPAEDRRLSAMIGGSSALMVREYQSPRELEDVIKAFIANQ